MKKILLTLLQILVTVGLLCWIFHDPEKRARMGEALRQANVIYLFCGVLVFGFVVVASTQRWRMLLGVQDIHLPWWKVWQLFMMGLFFNLFLPGGTGGDLIKIYYVLKEAPDRKSGGFLSVVVDRIIGALSLVFVTVILTALRFDVLTKTPQTRGLFFILVLIMGSFIAILACAFVVSKFGLVYKLPARMPLRETIVEFAKAIESYGKKPRTVLAAFGLGVMNQCFLFLSAYFAARAFTSALSVLDVFTVFPIILTLASLPISVAGIGVREQTTEQLLFTLYNIPRGVAVLISITSFFMMAFWGLIGGIVYLFYRPPGGHSRMSDIRAEVDAVETRIEKSA